MKKNTSTWMNRIFHNWNISRITRIVFGIGLIILGISSAERIIILFGSLLSLQGLLNLSCCGTGGCSRSDNGKQLYKDIIKPYKPKK